MNFVATSVFFAQMAYIENLGVRNVLLSDGRSIEGGMCHSDDNGNGGSLGLGDVRLWIGGSNPQTAPNRQYKDGSVVFSNGNARFDKDGNTTIANLTAKSGSFTGVEVHGSMRSAFTAPSGIGDVDVSDCISLISTGAGNVADPYSLPWDEKQSGRRITLVNWKWGRKVSTGYATIKAKDGKFFFEDGISKDALKMSRQVVELLGYGTANEFYGWIVMRRENIMTVAQYGRCMRALFWGKVRFDEDGLFLHQQWYDGNTSRAEIKRLDIGLYEISFPSDYVSNASALLVMATGFGYANGFPNVPCNATVVRKYNNRFEIMVYCDGLQHDGSFDFFVSNMNDWL